MPTSRAHESARLFRRPPKGSRPRVECYESRGQVTWLIERRPGGGLILRSVNGGAWREVAFRQQYVPDGVTIRRMDTSDEQIRMVIEGLLTSRQPQATICPSEAARTLAPGEWRPLMSRVRRVAVAMVEEGILEIRQGGSSVVGDGPLRGPIRLARPTGGHPTTPDGRYFVVRGRLWRTTNPNLPLDVRNALVGQLMDARRALRGRQPEAERLLAREQVDRAKHALGERGPVWWADGAPDFNRKLAKNTPYRDWFLQLPSFNAPSARKPAPSAPA